MIFKTKWLTIATLYLIVVDEVIETYPDKRGTFILIDCIDNSISLASID